jgi:hypothetical protein
MAIMHRQGSLQAPSLQQLTHTLCICSFAAGWMIIAAAGDHALARVAAETISILEAASHSCTLFGIQVKVYVCLLMPVQKPRPLQGYKRHARQLLLLLFPRLLLVLLLLLLLLLLLPQLCKLILMLFAVCSSLLLACCPDAVFVFAAAGVSRESKLASWCASSCRWCTTGAAAAAVAAAHMCLKCQGLLLSAHCVPCLTAQLRLALPRPTPAQQQCSSRHQCAFPTRGLLRNLHNISKHNCAALPYLHVAIWKVIPKLEVTKADPLYEGCPKVQQAPSATCRHAAGQSKH